MNSGKYDEEIIGSTEILYIFLIWGSSSPNVWRGGEMDDHGIKILAQQGD